MSPTPIIIRNARLVNEGAISDADVRLRGGRVEQIGASLQAGPNETVLDANGRYLLPGMIDDQVHFREPGLTAKGDLETESTAAVAGGITSFMDMPNVKPPTTNLAALAEKYVAAAGRARGNYAFYLGATNDNIDEVRRLRPADACGVKVFMGASTGNMLVDDPQTLERIFADAQTLIATHCENSPMIYAAEREYRERYGEDVPIQAHPEIRSAEACYSSSSFAVDLAKKNGSRLHVLHLTTARELELFEPGPVVGKAITAEVCVHHLFFDDSYYEELGTRIKCNPAIKTRADRDGLLRGVIEGRIDVIATDHAPHTLEEKARKYFDAPAGLPLVQHALLSLFEHFHEGRLPLELIVQKTSHSVADMFGIKDRGYVREGYWADLVLIDAEARTEVTPESVVAKCGWSPFEGMTFRSRIDTTIVNGEVVYTDGQATGAIPGQRLECHTKLK